MSDDDDELAELDPWGSETDDDDLDATEELDVPAEFDLPAGTPRSSNAVEISDVEELDDLDDLADTEPLGIPSEPLWGRLTIVCASANPDKAAEIAEILGDSVILLPRPPEIPDVVEDAATLVGNARLKARAICDATGQPAVSDDTGLEVDALGGLPGVRTARFAGEEATHADNRRKMLVELDGVPYEQRTARFRTVAMVCWPDGREVAVEGVCEGFLLAEERGGRGWGYDPLFVPADGDGRAFAEMTEHEKHDRSHRGRAFRALIAALDSLPRT
jgi:XTP/dITP diphosphohydrolase